MRGEFQDQGNLFSYISLEERVPGGHPLRRVRELIEAWASFKSFKPKDGSDDTDGSDFHKQKRGNDSHASTTDGDSRLYRKAQGREARLCYMGHALMENRHGLAARRERRSSMRRRPKVPATACRRPGAR